MREWIVITKGEFLKEMEEIENSEEYQTRIVFTETFWSSNFSIPRDFEYPDFNPRCFVGTRKEYDKITSAFFLKYGDTYGKITGSKSYNTLSEHLNVKRT